MISDPLRVSSIELSYQYGHLRATAASMGKFCHESRSREQGPLCRTSRHDRDTELGSVARRFRSAHWRFGFRTTAACSERGELRGRASGGRRPRPGRVPRACPTRLGRGRSTTGPSPQRLPRARQPTRVDSEPCEDARRRHESATIRAVALGRARRPAAPPTWRRATKGEGIRPIAGPEGSKRRETPTRVNGKRSQVLDSPCRKLSDRQFRDRILSSCRCRSHHASW
jgi:hypothetical protein